MIRNEKCCSLDCWGKIIAWIRFIVSATLSSTLLVGFFVLSTMGPGPSRVNKIIVNFEADFEGVLVKGYQMDGVMIRIVILIVIELFSALSGLFLVKAVYQGNVEVVSDWRFETVISLILRIFVVAPVVPFFATLDFAFTGLSIGIVYVYMRNLEAIAGQVIMAV